MKIVNTPVFQTTSTFVTPPITSSPPTEVTVTSHVSQLRRQFDPFRDENFTQSVGKPPIFSKTPGRAPQTAPKPNHRRSKSVGPSSRFNRNLPLNFN